MSSSAPSPVPERASSGVSRRKRLSRSTQKRKDLSSRQTQRRARPGESAAALDETDGGGGGGGPTRPELALREADDEAEEGPSRRWWPLFRVFVENKHLIQFFRICAFINLLSLMLSAPFVTCSEDKKGTTCQPRFLWYVVITCVDFLVSIVYTVQFVARIEYAIFLRFRKNRAGEASHSSLTSWYRLINLTLVTLSVWWSFAIGITRSVKEKEDGSDINPYLYIPVVFRSFAVLTTIQLFLNVQLPLSATELLGNIKWKQLFFVALFYLFFLYIFALVGVQMVGGLTHRCVYVNSDTNEMTLAVPVTHCNPNRSVYQKQCYGGSDRPDEIQCRVYPSNGDRYDIEFRNQVYFGQFRTILDAVFAVYEATSLELWSFFSYTADDGSPTPIGVAGFFYLAIVIYLVIFVQQSIFLVVIIESFADLRSAKAIGSTPTPKDKPLIVLTEQASATDLGGSLKLLTQQREESLQFASRLQKWYTNRIERFFLLLVAMDALITALKHSSMSTHMAITLQAWQMLASVLFVVEVVGLFIFYLVNTNQYSLLLRNAYYWYLTIVAIGGLVAALPIKDFYYPLLPANGLAVFQAARLPRLLRSNKTIKKFFFKIVGDGSKLLVIILLTGIFLMFFAVINMQFFGYLPPECKNVNGHFDNFFLALQSMFQLIMQEGWSEVMSEVMCQRDTWIPINFYFICLHLFASLILLNFFVAVILDNLDYDEDTKKELLQQVVDKKTTQKVPVHLKVLTACGPKLISAPKLSAAAAACVEVPNLTVADVKNFYESGETRDQKEMIGLNSVSPGSAGDQVLPQQQALSTAATATSQRRSSELSELNLLSIDSNASVASTHHERFQLIQGILESVRSFRKLNTDQEGSRRRPGLDGVGGRGGLFDVHWAQDNTTQQQGEDEYDTYRAKYRLFDSALFLMSPDNRLRKFCKAILTRQMREPPFIRTRLTPINFVKSRFSYYGRYLVSRLPYFSWLMLLITLLAIGVLLAELQPVINKPDSITYNDSGIIANGNSSTIATTPFIMRTDYIWIMDVIFVVFTLIQLILKILANGFFLNPDAAIRSVWDVMDWAIVICSAIVLILNTVVCGGNARQSLALSHAPQVLVAVLCVRALRPLRAVSLVPQMRRVIDDVLLGWKQLLFGVIVLLFAIFMFASLGVQLFAGDYPEGPQAFCNNPNARSLVECLNSSMVELRISTSREFLLNSNLSPAIMVPTVWYTRRRNFDFDDTASAMLTMFEVLTLEGWLDVRDMFVRNTVFPGIPRSKEAWYMAIFLHIFIFLGVNIGLQLFVGIVVNNFNANKPGNTALLSVGQKRWTDLVLRISLLRPIKRPTPPDHNRFRLFLYKVVINKRFNHFSTIMIILQSFCFCLPWSTGETLPTVTLISLVIVFAIYFILEQCVKLLAFGLKGYFGSWRNIADTLISVFSICFIIWALVVVIRGYDTFNHQHRTSLAGFAITYAVLKCFTILGKYSIMQNLTITVVRTFIGSTPLIFVLLFIILTYAFVGSFIFAGLRTGEDISLSRVKFDGAFHSFHLAFRVMTGEDWHHLLRDAMIGGHYCSERDGNCGNVAAAIIWFITYYMLITVLLLNIVIAHLLENFSIFYNQDDTSLSHTVIKDFRENWLLFDKTAASTIRSSQIKLFLRTLKLQHYYTYSLTEVNGVRFKIRDQVHVQTDSLILREMAEELRRGEGGVGGAGGAGGAGGGGGGGGYGKSGGGLSKQFSQETLNHEGEDDHSFQSVLKMLAYRAEDISERLEPQELYDRQEFEESIQFDVAEECILKWIKKYVKPILLERRDNGQAATVEEGQRRHPPPPRMDSLWLVEGTDTGLTMSVEDTDDEAEFMSLPTSNPLALRKLLGSPLLPTSEDQPEEPPKEDGGEDGRSKEEKMMAESYSRLAQISLTPLTQVGSGAGGEDPWHDWFRMQREWSENVDGVNQNYFDDGL